MCRIGTVRPVRHSLTPNKVNAGIDEPQKLLIQFRFCGVLTAFFVHMNAQNDTSHEATHIPGVEEKLSKPGDAGVRTYFQCCSNVWLKYGMKSR